MMMALMFECDLMAIDPDPRSEMKERNFKLDMVFELHRITEPEPSSAKSIPCRKVRLLIHEFLSDSTYLPAVRYE
jgi:hypothetical protein